MGSSLSYFLHLGSDKNRTGRAKGIVFFVFLNRKTKIGKKITSFLMKKQGIPRIITMEEIDERIDEIVNSSDDED